MDSAQPAIAVGATMRYKLTISPQIGYGLRMFPCHTYVLMAHCSSPMVVQSARETVAMLPTLHCAGTVYKHSSMEIVPTIGNKGYMYDISSNVIFNRDEAEKRVYNWVARLLTNDGQPVLCAKGSREYLIQGVGSHAPLGKPAQYKASFS